MKMRLLVNGSAQGRRQEPDRSLLRLLARAQRFQAKTLQGDGRIMRELATEVGVTSSYFTRILRLSFLAPEITKAILDGHQPPELSAAKLARVHDLPVSWARQARVLGFDI